MKKKFTMFFASLAMMASSVFAGGNYTYDLIGTTFMVDTLFHSKVGPGTTQTSLLFQGPSYNMRVFYLTVSLDAPTVAVRSVSGKDKMAGAETVSEMAVRRSVEGEQFFAGVNGDFWVTSGTTMRGESCVGAPISASIIDGEIFKTSEQLVQFALDVNNVPYIGRATFVNNTATCGDRITSFKGVNVGAYGEGITLYTSKYYSGTNEKQAGSSEVQARLADGEKFKAGQPCKFVITGVPSTAGDMDIPEEGFVLHGCGSSAEGGNMGGYEFVNSLKEGDVVTLTSNVEIDGVKIVPQQMISGNVITTANGVTLTETDDGSVHPRTGIGFSADGKKIIMMVIDGRSAISYGARTSQLSDIMRYAGAYRAMNMDGGGSSACYTQALGVRNIPSDGKERADANAIFAVCMAPTDKEIAEIRFVDWAMQFPKYGIYTPKFFGFNKYGLLVDTDVKGVKLSCPAELGTIKNDGATFVGSGEGLHALTATYNGLTASIPVAIVPTEDVKMAHESVINDGYRKYAVEVKAKVNEDYLPLDPAALTWSCDDATVVEIDAETGILKGVKDGTACVHGKMDDFDGTMTVVVEKPTARCMAVDANFDPTTWTVTQVGGTDGKLTSIDNGFRYSYTGKSGRAPYIKLSKTQKIWSLPDTLRLRVNAGDAPLKNVTVALKAANGIQENIQLQYTAENGKASVMDVPMDSWCDPADISTYPITVNYIYFTMGASTAGKYYTIDVPGFEGVYSAVGSSSGVEGVATDGIMNVNIYSIDGRLVKQNAKDLNGLDNGIYIINNKKVVITR